MKLGIISQVSSWVLFLRLALNCFKTGR
jgi:hypothetical protein